MEHWLFSVQTTCVNQDREEDFNRWYDEIHIPDVLKGCPDFRVCRRYKLISEGGKAAEYLTLIEIETDDIQRTMEIHRNNGERIRTRGRWTDLINVISRRLYKLEQEF